MALSKYANMKNVSTGLARVDTDAQSNIWIGGGKSDARNLVGEEFAEITGGSKINFGGRHGNELEGLLEAILTSSGNEAPGLDGVELISLTSDSFVIMYTGWLGSKNYIEFTGSAAEAAIDGLVTQLSGNNGVNLKNSASQFTIFDTDDRNSIFVGDSGAASAEAKALIGGSSLKVSEAEDLLIATVTGKASNGTAGVDGVELIGLTDEGFTLRIDGQGATVDTIVFEGQGAVDAIAAADAAQGANFKDGNTALDVFDLATESNEFVGDTNAGIIGADFDALIGGSKIHDDQVLDIFDALITGNARRGDTGLDEVELVGMNETSFSIAVNTSGGNTDYILFKNVHLLDGADDFGFVAEEVPDIA